MFLGVVHMHIHKSVSWFFHFLFPHSIFSYHGSHAQLHYWAVGISQKRPLGAYPNPLNLWEPQTVKNKEILNI